MDIIDNQKRGVVMSVGNHINILGLPVREKVTGLVGVATSVSFDLYGCIQVVVTPPAREDKVNIGHWFDINRLEILDRDKRVIPVPNFDDQSIANGDHGPAEKPALN